MHDYTVEMQRGMKMLPKIFSFVAVLVGNFGVSGNITFPANFMLGAATGAYQIEGAWNGSGKGPSIWDTLTHSHTDKIADGSNGDVASDSYRLYREDVQLLKDLGLDFYRFSISWPRILPTGHVHRVNQAGIDYYNNLINELKANSLEPVVTMYHWDLPQSLQDLGGWANPVIAEYFQDYAHVLFSSFGDRVKWWITLNEPSNVALGYATATAFAPAVNAVGTGNYMATHTMLLAHANAYRLYDDRFRKTQQGKVGITLYGEWYEPIDNKSANVAARDRAIQFMLGSYAHPIFSPQGDYPVIVKNRIAKKSTEEGFIRSRFPPFTPEEVKHIQGTSDFFGLNHYTTRMIQHDENIGVDSDVEMSANSRSSSAASRWFNVVPSGFRELLVWIKNEYNNPPVLVTANGHSDVDGLHDTERTRYYVTCMVEMLSAIEQDNCNVFGYAVWSLIDNFEWTKGYTERSGLFYVNFSDDGRRIPKDSAFVLSDIARTRHLPQSLIYVSREVRANATSSTGIRSRYTNISFIMWLAVVAHVFHILIM